MQCLTVTTQLFAGTGTGTRTGTRNKQGPGPRTRTIFDLGPGPGSGLKPEPIKEEELVIIKRNKKLALESIFQFEQKTLNKSSFDCMVIFSVHFCYEYVTNQATARVRERYRDQ